MQASGSPASIHDMGSEHIAVAWHAAAHTERKTSAEALLSGSSISLAGRVKVTMSHVMMRTASSYRVFKWFWLMVQIST